MNIVADGFSPAYIRAIAFATACYGLAGLLLCYRLARRFTGIWSATVAVLLVLADFSDSVLYVCVAAVVACPGIVCDGAVHCFLA